MDLGAVTLLEVSPLAHQSTRIAWCLPSGAFVLVTKAASSLFGVSSPLELRGQNVTQFLTRYDTEKLHEFLHRCARDGNANGAGALPPGCAQSATVLVRVAGTSSVLALRLVTTALTLRMLRCMDAVTANTPCLTFTDASSFVLHEEELAFHTHRPPTHAISAASPLWPDEVGDDHDEPKMTYHLPLELKHDAPECDCRVGVRTPSPTSLSDESLSSMAFEEDWTSELLNQSSR